MGIRPSIILPARDEAAAVGAVVRRVPAALKAVVIVVDNGSRDSTARVARAAGAEVVAEPRPGYGWACLAGSRRAQALGCDVAVFLDADGSMDPE
jgi:glycosyltransferase involved in cell wall biosynthesis